MGALIIKRSILRRLKRLSPSYISLSVYFLFPRYAIENFLANSWFFFKTNSFPGIRDTIPFGINHLQKFGIRIRCNIPRGADRWIDSCTKRGTRRSKNLPNRRSKVFERIAGRDEEGGKSKHPRTVSSFFLLPLPLLPHLSFPKN